MTEHFFQALLHDQPVSQEFDEQFPFYPLTSPGMATPGPDFERVAKALGDDVPFREEKIGGQKQVIACGPRLQYLYRRALYDGNFQLTVQVKGRAVPASFLPGHVFTGDAEHFNGGPVPCRVMLIGKQPGQEEFVWHRNFCGPTAEPLMSVLQQLGIDERELEQWYVTNLVKHPQLDRQSDGLPQAWIRNCRPLLDQELRLVRPDYILCLGSHAAKALLGTHAAVTNMVGRVENLYIPLHDAGESPRYHTAKVMAAVHPAAVYRLPELYEPFKDQLSLFVQLSHGVEIGARETSLDHRVVYTHRALKRIVDEVRADPTRWQIAIDGEWHGDYPTEPGAYLRTIQFSTRHGEGITVALRYQHGYPAFQPSIGHAIYELNRLLKHDPATGYTPRVGGWFLRADMPWLIHNGIDCRAEFTAAATHEAHRTGGFAADLQYHAVYEAASYKLEDVATRLTTAPRYDKALQHWKNEFCHVHDLASDALEGYGACPDWILHPYACYDPDVTRRISVKCEEPGGLLDSDVFGNQSWRPYWVAHRASLGFLEMEMNGIMLDRARVDELTQKYMTVREQLLADFRRRINWPEFNPDSTKHCAAFLFGDDYSFRLDPEGRRLPIRPPQAVTLSLTPIKTTGKRSKVWSMVMSRGEAHLYTPSTDRETLGIVGHEHPLAMQLRDIKFVNQALKLALRPPVVDAANNVETDEEGFAVYERGLASFAHSDNRVRTHLSQHKETGRAASARPPLQNLSSRREDDFSRILGTWSERSGQRLAEGDYTGVFLPCYDHPIRSIFRASPGHVLVEVDYTGAELAVIAWLAGDPVMIEHVRRNILPENHPDHYDIHSQTAVRAFALTCPPTKRGLKEAGKKGLRVAAKNVNFGIPYGRMAPAISRQCREEGVHVTVDETQRLIDTYFATYQGTVQFLRECRNRVRDPQWLCTAFGRIRRFFKSTDKQVLGEQERQSQNFPIQGTVADTVSRAVDNLYYYRQEVDVQYRLLLQIHDAILCEVPIPYLAAFISGTDGRPSVIQECMINRVPIWPTYLDGTPQQQVTEPYHFGVDYKVMLNWGEEVTDEQAAELGIPAGLI